MTRSKSMLMLALALALPASAQPASELETPVRILADGKPIDVDIGHAAPCFADVDGDGLKDLLVGQFGDGKLRIYRNLGAAGAPRFGAFTWFNGGRKDGRVPTG